MPHPVVNSSTSSTSSPSERAQQHKQAQSVLSPRVKRAAAEAARRSSSNRSGRRHHQQYGGGIGDAAEIRSNIRDILNEFERESEADARRAGASIAGLQRSFTNPHTTSVATSNGGEPAAAAAAAAVSYPGYSVRKSASTPSLTADIGHRSVAATHRAQPSARPAFVVDTMSAADRPNSSSSSSRSTGGGGSGGGRGRTGGTTGGARGANVGGNGTAQINFSTIASNIRNGKLKLEQQQQLVEDLREQVSEAQRDVERAKADGKRKLEAQKKKVV